MHPSMAVTDIGTIQPLGLVGRAAELAAFRSAISALHSGRGGVLLLAGEPGIGKSSVLQAAAASAAAEAVVVRWASCPPDDAAPPYWPVLQLLSHPPDAALQTARSQLNGTAETATSTQHRFRLFSDVADALRQVAMDRPQMLVVDDLHWADPSTLRLLHFLIKQLAAAPVLLAGAYRDTELTAEHPLLEILAEPGASGQTIALQGLSAAAVADLARRTGVDDPGPARAETLREHTGGNPFFVLNAARLILAEHEATGRDATLTLPVGVRAVLERRLARLSQPCHTALRSAAVVGATFDINLLAQVTGVQSAQLQELMEEAVVARLLEGRGPGRYAFVHALVQAASYEQIPAAHRTDLHGRVADVIRASAGGEQRLAELARHELRAGAARAAAAGASAAMAAGDHAMTVRAYEEAAEHYARAAAATDDPRATVEAHLAAGGANRHAGRWDAADTAYLAAAAGARSLGSGELLARAALGVGADSSGFEVRLHDQRQMNLLADALDALGPGLPRLESRLLARRAVASTNITELQRRQQWADRSVALARQSDDARVLVYALSAWCDVHAGPAHVADRLRIAAEMLDAATARGDLEGALLARRLRVVALLEAADPAVHDEIAAYADESRALGVPLYTWYVALWRGMQATMRGELTAGLTHAAEAAELGAEAGSDNAMVLAGTLRSNIMLEQGLFEPLMQMYAEAVEQFPHLQNTPIGLAMRPLIAVVEGDVVTARASLKRLAAGEFSQVPVDSEWLSTLTAVAASVLAISDVNSAEVLYRVLRPHRGVMAVDGIAAACLDPVDYLLGRLAVLLGRPTDAIEHLTAAVALCRRIGAHLLVAHSEYELGALVAADGDESGVALRAAALRVIEDAGGVPFSVTMARHLAASPQNQEPGQANTTPAAAMRREGAVWQLEFSGRAVRLPDAKGLHDLRYLLSRPGQGVPAVQLQRAGSELEATAASHGADALDDQARDAYRRRVAELDAAVAAAESDHDLGRAERLRDERAFLLAELSAAVGLGGRPRRLGDDVDRARKAVTMRVRNAIERIAREHPELGRHLQRSVRTGATCTYDPERPVDWRL